MKKNFAILCLALASSVIAANNSTSNRILTLAPAGASQPAGDEGGDADVVKKLNNPISSLTSVPFQNNFDFGAGPNGDGFQYKLNFQPVIPVPISKDWNLINRFIVPFIHQEDVIAKGRSETGLSDTTASFFLSPKESKIT